MPDFSRVVQLTTLRDRPIVAGGVRLTRESQVLSIRLPFGGAVWHRPTAVSVERAGRAVQRLPIVDLTRVAQLAVLLATLLLTVVYLLASSPRKEP